MPPMPPARGAFFHDRIIFSYHIARFINKRRAASIIPKTFEEFFWVARDKIGIPIGRKKRVKRYDGNALSFEGLRFLLRECRLSA